MEIIKRGQLPQDQVHNETCGHCKSELQFKHSEVTPSPDQRDAGLWFVTCPVCKNQIFRESK